MLIVGGDVVEMLTKYTARIQKTAYRIQKQESKTKKRKQINADDRRYKFSISHRHTLTYIDPPSP
jgi:hypothetical protein